MSISALEIREAARHEFRMTHRRQVVDVARSRPCLVVQPLARQSEERHTRDLGDAGPPFTGRPGRGSEIEAWSSESFRQCQVMLQAGLDRGKSAYVWSPGPVAVHAVTSQIRGPSTRRLRFGRRTGLGFHRGRLEFGQVGQSTADSGGGDVELGGPADAVQHQGSQVGDLPVAVVVRHDDAQAAAAVGTLNRPDHRLFLRGLRAATSW